MSENAENNDLEQSSEDNGPMRKFQKANQELNKSLEGVGGVDAMGMPDAELQAAIDSAPDLSELFVNDEGMVDERKPLPSLIPGMKYECRQGLDQITHAVEVAIEDFKELEDRAALLMTAVKMALLTHELEWGIGPIRDSYLPGWTDNKNQTTRDAKDWSPCDGPHTLQTLLEYLDPKTSHIVKAVFYADKEAVTRRHFRKMADKTPEHHMICPNLLITNNVARPLEIIHGVLTIDEIEKRVRVKEGELMEMVEYRSIDKTEKGKKVKDSYFCIVDPCAVDKGEMYNPFASLVLGQPMVGNVLFIWSDCIDQTRTKKAPKIITDLSGADLKKFGNVDGVDSH
jgi:hypothetical protein